MDTRNYGKWVVAGDASEYSSHQPFFGDHEEAPLQLVQRPERIPLGPRCRTVRVVTNFFDVDFRPSTLDVIVYKV